MAGILTVAFLYFRKTDASRESLVAEIAKDQSELSNLHTATAGIENLGKKIDELQKAIDFFQSRLPQEREIDKILTEVSKIAQANNLQTKTIRTLKSERFASFSEQPIQLSLSGDFNGFYSFLLQLEKLPRLTRITEMRMAKIDDHDGAMTAQMNMSIFFEPDTVAAAN
jgi:type IV pilus assembly protein PilO